MSYLSSIFAYRVLALLLLLDCLYPLCLLHCADFVEFAVVSGDSNCLLVGAAWIQNAMLCC